MPSNSNVSIVEFDKSESDGHRFWKSKLVVKNGSTTIIEKYPIFEEYGDNYFYYLVPVKPRKYFVDLDGDKFYEFAVAVDHGGNAAATSATVYSFRGAELKIYKKAWYQMENGQEVIWNYEKAPKKYIH